MRIPKSINVGGTEYTVCLSKFVRHKGRPAHGYISYAERRIYMATHSSITRRKFTKNEMYDTFWHELTHALLRSMKNPLYSNERFVRRFATSLTNAIISAKL